VGDLQADVTHFSAFEKGGDFSFDEGVIMRGQRSVVKLEDTKMRGLHNAENIMAAVSAAMAMGVSEKDAVAAAKNFTPPPHRCEWVRTLNGVEYLNDSKATNLHALQSAIASQSREIILIAGGKEKGLAYEALLPLLRERVTAVFTIGEIADDLAKLFSSEVKAQAVGDLENAVMGAQEIASEGAVVLFSPGTSSFDQFPGYEARGEAFKKCVRALK